MMWSGGLYFSKGVSRKTGKDLFQMWIYLKSTDLFKDIMDGPMQCVYKLQIVFWFTFWPSEGKQHLNILKASVCAFMASRLHWQFNDRACDSLEWRHAAI